MLKMVTYKNNKKFVLSRPKTGPIIKVGFKKKKKKKKKTHHASIFNEFGLVR